MHTFAAMKHGVGAGVGADVDAGVRLSNFLKCRVWVRQDAAIKKLLKIFLFIFFIYC